MPGQSFIRSLVASVFLIGGLAASTHAQPWIASEVWYGGPRYDVLRGGCRVADGGIVFVGQQSSPEDGFPDLYVERLSPNGETLWSVTQDVTRMDELISVCPGVDGGFLAVGATSNAGDAEWDGYVLKLTDNGDTSWSIQHGAMGNDQFIATVSDGTSYYVAGHTRPGPWQFSEMALLRISAGGEIEWYEMYGGDRDDMTTALARASNGNLLIAGYTHSFEAPDSDLLLVLVDANGGLLNIHHEVRPLPQTCVNLVADGDSFYAAGSLYLDVETEQPTPYLMRINDQGIVEWTIVYDNEQPADVLAFNRMLNGDLVLGGQTWFGGHGFVWRIDSHGRILQQWQSNHAGQDRIQVLLEQANNTVLFAGSSSSGAAQVFDFYRGSLSSVSVGPIRTPLMPELSYHLWPNPFNASFTLSTTLPTPGTMTVRMVNLLGQEVLHIADGRFLNGTHRFHMNTDTLPSGMYVIEIRAQDHPVHWLKAMLVK